MSETVRRYRIRSDRPLIETERVIDSDLSWIVTQLDGSHLEILRNLMAYAHERTAYVSEYGPDWYLIPDDDEWDAIDAIVSELEERLMPADNIPFGIYEQWTESESTHLLDPQQFNASTDAVPAGYYYVLQRASMFNATGQRGSAYIGIYDGSNYHYLSSWPAPLANQMISIESPLVLQEGDRVFFSQNSCQGGDDIFCEVWGYKIKLPG